MYVRALALLATLAFLASCGGGGGGGPTVSDPTQPRPNPPDETPSRQPGASLAGIEIELRAATDHPPAARVVSYLRSQLSGGPWPHADRVPPGLARFDRAPTVRIVEGASAEHRELVHQAVASINRHLPHEHHLRIGTAVGAPAAIGDVPDNQIVVHFAPKTAWPNPSAPYLGQAELDAVEEHDAAQGRRERTRLRASRVWVDADRALGDLEHTGLLALLNHELMHALGFPGHVPATAHSDSILNDGHWADVYGRVPAIDGASLRAIYTRYSNGADPEDVSATSLGPWAATATTLAGRVDGMDLQFGVTRADGVAVPWTMGSPGRHGTRALADNRDITGSATWRGGLVGFTPDNRSVAGTAAVTVDVGTLTGRADFAELQSWPEGTAPGALGTGTRWNTGSLGYAITVTGPYIRSTGAGELSGSFYADHEGVAGTLDRRDLTAAFGASRRSAQ